MLKLFDTSVLVAALCQAHVRHDVAIEQLDGALSGTFRIAVSAHAIAEIYATLTVLQLRPMITPGQTAYLIEENVLKAADVINLDKDDYVAAVRRMTALGMKSGAIYDALHVVAAEKAHADELLTLNRRDFARMPPVPPTKLVVL